MNPLPIIAAIAGIGLAWAWTVWRSYWKGWDDADRAADARIGRLLRAHEPDPSAGPKGWRLIRKPAADRKGAT